MDKKAEFIKWMDIRLAEKTGTVAPEDAITMGKMVAKYKYNNSNEDQQEYTAEEQRSLDAATIVYLLGM